VLIVEPLAHQAKTLLARVTHSTADEAGWLHGCELSSCLSAEELRVWLAGHAGPRTARQENASRGA
jgi:hypothetical protein